jgi:hypothetical protein
MRIHLYWGLIQPGEWLVDPIDPYDGSDGLVLSIHRHEEPVIIADLYGENQKLVSHARKSTKTGRFYIAKLVYPPVEREELEYRVCYQDRVNVNVRLTKAHVLGHLRYFVETWIVGKTLHSAVPLPPAYDPYKDFELPSAARRRVSRFARV